LKYVSALSLLLLILCSTISANAQSTDATISGVVVDSSGKVIPNADIEILNEGTGVHYSDKTNGAGIYTVSILPPGQYLVQVSKAGFKTLIKPGITLNVQSALALNFTLPVGATSESVTVEAGTSTINTTDASVSTVIDRKFVENIPLNGRSFQDLISMTPGVVTESPQTTNQAVGYNGDFSVNGQRTESNYYTVDGVSGNVLPGNGNGGPQAAVSGSLGGATALGTTQSLISVDALQEFRVESSTYSAQYGRTPGGQFALVTRSGGDTLHGSAFEYLRNNFFDANDWFNDHYGDPISALRQNDFGGTLGGPLRLNRGRDENSRTFFFGSYEGLRLTQPQAASIQYVPDLELRQNAALALQPILNAFPLPSANGIDYGTLAQFIEPYSLPGQIDSTSVRLDRIITPSLSAFFRYGYTPTFTGSRTLSQVKTTRINTETYTFGATAQISPSMSDEFRTGYSRGDASHSGLLDAFGGATPIDLASALGAAGNTYADPVFELYFSGVGLTSLQTQDASNRSSQWNVVNTFNWSIGRHQLKFGADFRNLKSPTVPDSPMVEGLFETAQALTDDRANLLVIENTLSSEPVLNESALFGQDEWTLTPNLHLSLGLRWEVDPPPTGGDGRNAYTLEGSLAAPNTLQLAPAGTPLWKTTWYNFAPRTGVAWQIRHRPGQETVLRSGFGVFFDSADEEAINGFQGIGFLAYEILYGQSLPVPRNEVSIIPSTTPPYTSASIYAFPSHLQLPYTLEWNTSLQQALGTAQTFTISYVGSNGRRLIQEQELSLSALNPNFGNVYYFPTGLSSNYQALQVQFQRSVHHGVQALASYTWSHSFDYGSSNTALPLERGDSDFDVRNNLQAGLSCDLPNLQLTHGLRWILDDWAVDARLNARTAFPVALFGTLETDAANGSQYYSGVNLIPNQPLYLFGSEYPGGRAINPSAFAAPASGGVGNAPRNFVRGFGATQLNVATRHEFQLYEGVRLQFRAETFNLLNHPNFGYIDSTLSDATFGQALQMLNQSLGTVSSLYQQGGPRSMQFALKVTF
jgi:hypothetical protein